MQLTDKNRIALEMSTPFVRDTTVAANTEYYYVITAVKDGVESQPSREDSDTTFPAAKVDTDKQTKGK